MSLVVLRTRGKLKADAFAEEATKKTSATGSCRDGHTARVGRGFEGDAAPARCASAHSLIAHR
jgi:hypothetical protein